MNVKVNDKEVDTQAHNLLQLSEELQLPAKGVAIAVNQDMIPRPQWPDFNLKEGMDIIIIKAVCGG